MADTPERRNRASSGPSRLSKYLTLLAHASAPFLSTFLIIHLSAPMMANVGGSELSSNVMILGREYYRTSFGHKFLVVLPILIHTTSALAKRLTTPASRRPRKLTSPFALTGYTAALVLIPIHYLVHRVNPSDPAPPIERLAPSELDFEYVKYGLQHWPWRSWILYAGTTLCVAWHVAEGENILWNTWLRRWLPGWRNSVKTRAMIVTAVVAPVLTGLFVISREPLMAFTSSIARFDAAYLKSFVYQI